MIFTTETTSHNSFFTNFLLTVLHFLQYVENLKRNAYKRPRRENSVLSYGCFFPLCIVNCNFSIWIMLKSTEFSGSSKDVTLYFILTINYLLQSNCHPIYRPFVNWFVFVLPVDSLNTAGNLTFVTVYDKEKWNLNEQQKQNYILGWTQPDFSWWKKGRKAILWPPPPQKKKSMLGIMGLTWTNTI